MAVLADSSNHRPREFAEDGEFKTSMQPLQFGAALHLFHHHPSFQALQEAALHGVGDHQIRMQWSLTPLTVDHSKQS